ncbi:hypothetical protein [Chitinophaga sp. CF418]|nr:hypothetical protein [Chitinophaga sp. CF418]SHN45865.1 hypothetical protein SAMN05216311_1223 [Chitinophaga sp. CF418]
MNEKATQAAEAPQEVSTEAATVTEQVPTGESSVALTGVPEGAEAPAE